MYEHITPETLRADMLENIDYWSKNEGTMVSTLLAAPAYAIWQWYTNLEAVQYMVFPDENSGVWIDKQANQYGITRKPGEPARCVMTLTGSSGVTVPAGKVFQTPEGIQFATDQNCVLNGGTGTVTATAVEAGTAGNIGENELTVQKSVTRGLSSWTHTAATGGVDEETDASLLSRYYDRLRKPATSGNVYHYEQWAREVPGVGAVKVYPLWDGPGTVRVVIAGDGYTVPDEEVVEATASHIGRGGGCADRKHRGGSGAAGRGVAGGGEGRVLRQAGRLPPLSRLFGRHRGGADLCGAPAGRLRRGVRLYRPDPIRQGRKPAGRGDRHPDTGGGEPD